MRPFKKAEEAEKAPSEKELKHDPAYATPPTKKSTHATGSAEAPNAPARPKGTYYTTFSARRLFVPDEDTVDSSAYVNTAARVVTTNDLAQRERRLSLMSSSDAIDKRTKAMQFLVGHESTRLARRNVEDNGRVAMSVNEEGIVRLAQQGGALHLTYSSVLPTPKRSQGERLDTVMNVSVPLGQGVDKLFASVVKEMGSLTDRSVEEFGGHALQMAIDNELNNALEPRLVAALGAVSNAAASCMVTRMARAAN